MVEPQPSIGSIPSQIKLREEAHGQGALSALQIFRTIRRFEKCPNTNTITNSSIKGTLHAEKLRHRHLVNEGMYQQSSEICHKVALTRLVPQMLF